MRRYSLEVGQSRYVIDVDEITANRFRVLVGEQEYEVCLAGDEAMPEAQISPAIGPSRHAPLPAPGHAALPPRPSDPAAPPRSASAGPTAPPPPTAAALPGVLTAPMPGKILSVAVGRGDLVSRGQTLLTLEAMKMKNAIKAPCDGVVMEVLVREEQTVPYGEVLMRLEQS